MKRDFMRGDYVEVIMKNKNNIRGTYLQKADRGITILTKSGKLNIINTPVKVISSNPKYSRPWLEEIKKRGN